MNENQNIVISLVMMQISPNTPIDEGMIKEYVSIFAMLNPLTEIQTDEVIASLHSKLAIRMDRGSYVKEKDHATWYYSSKRDSKTEFWERYRTYLFKEVGFNSDVTNTLDVVTDEIMDLMGNPMNNYNFQRRGLVIGDVQSGKTATYTGLINKAADSGYRIIILLTGTIEKLRRQTQGRLDEGFIGLDSTAFNRDQAKALVGVGNINPSITGWAVTSTSSDFNTSTARKLSGKLSGINDPIIFVLKKNKSVLEKLENWLRIFNANEVTHKIDMPMLLIDDEADNASVNTKKEEDSPTAINSCIRKLLKLFDKANYVGFTATPFANIFIDPDTTEEMLEDDLFPKDFIYVLEPPTNYVGARGIFSNGSKYSYMLKENDDCEYYLPLKHKKDFQLFDLPLSLKTAIASFFISNAVRDLRGDKTKHRSMLVNVSRFIVVQDSITSIIDQYVREFQREVRSYFRLGDEALIYKSFKFIKEVYHKHFETIPNFEFKWEDIQFSLHEAISSIVVRSINGGNASKNLNYDEYKEEGLRLIAVGGYSLSRGLTLEGLCVSYFYRNSKMYDTLMQMGRWFGYRDSYADICQIWMAEEAVEWYSHISVASDELRLEVRRMQAENRTPNEFGLCVRSDLNILQVTARNKMRTAKDYTMAISLDGKVIETPFLHMDKEIVADNYKSTEYFIKQLNLNGYHFSDDLSLAIKHPQILSIPKSYIIDYLNIYKSHSLNMNFRTDDLVNIINTYTDDTVENWDIVIANGDANLVQFCGIPIKPVLRGFSFREESGALQMSGTKIRLGSTTFAKAGMSNSQIKTIEDYAKNEQKIQGVSRALSQEIYFTSGIKRNPLLIIYPVSLNPIKKDKNGLVLIDEEKQKIMDTFSTPIIGLAIGIPRINGRQSVLYKYKINLIKYKELFEIDDDFEEFDNTMYEED